MKNKLFILLFSIVSVALAGCGSSSNSTDKDDSKVSLTYAIWDDSQKSGLEKIAEEFTKENPDIQVTVEVIPGEQYWTKLDAAAKGDNLPDIFWMHSDVADKYMSNNMLMDLTDSSIDWSQYPEDLVKLYSYNDKNFAVPKDFDTIGLWYNKTLFDNAGVEYPNENWTWDDLKNAAEKLTDQSNGIYGFAAPNNNQIGYLNFVYQNDGKTYSEDKTSYLINDANSVEALEYYYSFIKDGYSPSLSIMEETDSSTLFSSGKVAMSMNGSWMVSSYMKNDYVVENCDVAVLPKGERQATIFNGLGNAVAASSKNPEAAKKFVEFLGSEKANEIQAETATAISAYESTTSKWVENTNSVFNTQVFVDMLPTAEILPYSKYGAQVNDIQNEELVKAFSGELSIQEATDNIVERADKILSE